MRGNIEIAFFWLMLPFVWMAFLVLILAEWGSGKLRSRKESA